jgi:transcriptional regulator with XRE-family HTH domain
LTRIKYYVLRLIMQVEKQIIRNRIYVDGMAKSGRPTERARTGFGQRLAQAREEAELSQQELAHQLGVSARAICWWEREPTALKPEQLAALADVLGVSVDYLLGRQNQPRRGTGPVGRAKRAFERVSKLPRAQQQHILKVVEAFVEAKNGSAK